MKRIPNILVFFTDQQRADSCGCYGIVDLINLTFSCQQITIITDFTDLEEIGQSHYMDLNGGTARLKDLESLDGRKMALALIESGGGRVTPYGVVYDNGMTLSQLYDGHRFPEYFYESCLASVILSLPDHPKERETLYFPCAESKISRTLRRLGAERPEQCVAMLDTSEISNAVRGVFEDEYPLNEHVNCYKMFQNDLMCVMEPTPQVLALLEQRMLNTLQTSALTVRGLKRFVKEHKEYLNTGLGLNPNGSNKKSIFMFYILFLVGKSEGTWQGLENVNDFIKETFGTDTINVSDELSKQLLLEMLETEGYFETIKAGAVAIENWKYE